MSGAGEIVCVTVADHTTTREKMQIRFLVPRVYAACIYIYKNKMHTHTRVCADSLPAGV